MSWSWKLGQIAGIDVSDVSVHATFLILLVWVALSDYLPGGSPAAAASGVLFILAVFGAVVLHELGHALTARRFGIATRDITLLPIGGVSRLERIPEDPRMDRVRATEITARMGQALALLLGCAGLFFNPFLIFIAFFVWMGAAQEAAATQLRGALDGIPVGRLMVVDAEGDAMRKQLLSLSTLLGVMFVLGASRVQAQIVEDIVADVPFPFHAGSARFPAGKYTLKVPVEFAQKEMEIVSADLRNAAFFPVISAQASTTPDKPQVIFRKYGDEYHPGRSSMRVTTWASKSWPLKMRRRPPRARLRSGR